LGQTNEYGAVLDVPITAPLLKNTKLEILPSASDAFARTPILAGAEKTEPLAGAEIWTVGLALTTTSTAFDRRLPPRSSVASAVTE
jgi:hypothetical protein